MTLPVPELTKAGAPLPLLAMTELTVTALVDWLMKIRSPVLLAVELPTVMVPGVADTPMVKAPEPGATKMPPASVTPVVVEPAPRRRIPCVVEFLTSMVRAVVSEYLRVLMLIVPVAAIVTFPDVALLMR